MALKNAFAGMVLVLAACNGGGGGDDDGDDTNVDTTMSDSSPSSGDADDDGTGDSETGDDSNDESADEGDPEEICDGLTFDNLVDEAACPYIQGQNVDPEPADMVEFCRRAYIDLLGSSPTATEYEASCKNRDFAEVIADFTARPDYVRMSQRMWADVFHMNSDITYYPYIAALDVMAGELHQGTRSLDQFAIDGATSPGFLGRWDGLDLVAFNFLAFLGRDANSSERMELVPLFRMWEERDLVDPNDGTAMSVVLNTLNCAPPNEASCYSDFWGDNTLIIPPPVPGDVDPMGPNVIDQSLLTPAQRDQLALPGQLIAQQGAFYEAYVDRALQRYLGYDLGVQIQPVRQALVDMLVDNGGMVVEVDREILTSGLYISTNEHEEEATDNPDDWDPAYWHGPVKQMDAEVWLSSAQKLIGYANGSCDHRYPEVQSGAGGLHPHTYPTTDGVTPDYAFRDDARLLGGCPDRLTQFRETRAGLIAALTQATLTESMCAAANEESLIYPLQFVEDPNDKTEDALTTAADQIFRAAIIRPIADGAQDGLMAGVDGCRDELDCTPVEFAVQTCRLVLKSADFLFY